MVTAAYSWESSKQIYLGGFDTEEQAALVSSFVPILYSAVHNSPMFTHPLVS